MLESGVSLYSLFESWFCINFVKWNIDIYVSGHKQLIDVYRRRKHTGHTTFYLFKYAYFSNFFVLSLSINMNVVTIYIEHARRNLFIPITESSVCMKVRYMPIKYPINYVSKESLTTNIKMNFNTFQDFIPPSILPLN